MDEKTKLIKYIEENPNLTYESVLHLLKTKENEINKNRNLTEMGRYLNASYLTPSETGMSSGRCPI